MCWKPAGSCCMAPPRRWPPILPLWQPIWVGEAEVRHGTQVARRGSAAEVLLAFLRLGLSSFGGPVAHLGYFRTEFVGRRRWLDEAAFADLVALCQFLPGPASSQVCISLGRMRAGLPGAACAWAGFTLPSAIAM